MFRFVDADLCHKFTANLVERKQVSGFVSSFGFIFRTNWFIF